MNSTITILYFILGLLLSFICGYGVITFLLPKELREYRFLLMMPLGYGVVSWLTDSFAIAFSLTLLTATKVVFPLLVFVAVVAYFLANPRDTVRDISRGLLEVFLLSLPICIFILWPLFYVGAETFQAAVNPDWWYALHINYHLKDNPLNWSDVTPIDTYHPFIQHAAAVGSTSAVGRYSGGFYAILLEWLFPVSEVMALSLTVGIFFFCMPLALYFMVRVALKQPKAVAILSTVLLAISSPIAASFLLYFIGQNSGLPIMLISLTVLFLFFQQSPSWKSVFLSAILLSVLLSLYLSMLPFTVAPIGLIVMYLLLSRGASFFTVSKASFYLMVSFVLLSLPVLTERFLQITFTLGAGQGTSLLPNKYFSIFLTEVFLPLMLGIRTLSVSESEIVFSTIVSFVITLFLLSILLIEWVKKRNKIDWIVLASYVLVLVLAWWRFVFSEVPFSYGAFKITMWLQFVPISLSAIGFYLLWNKTKVSSLLAKLIYFPILATFVFILEGGNLFATFHYTRQSLGNDLSSMMVVVHNVSGNQDYLELADKVSNYVKPDETIGLTFVNVAQSTVVGYYLRSFKLSLLNQYDLPGEYEILPDLVTREYVDTSGALVTDNSSGFFHGATDDFYLTWNGSDVIEKTTAKPLWENKTFRLYKASETPDFAFIGRGFYRYETSP
ncbi:MAG: hypothetical protein BWK78_02595, partial [Thiotrichaceae bacterium IS1]